MDSANQWATTPNTLGSNSLTSLAGNRKLSEMADNLPDITITSQHKPWRPRSPLRTSYVPSRDDVKQPEGEDLNSVKVLSQSLLSAIELKTPERESTRHIDTAESRSPLLTPPLSECSTDSANQQLSPLFAAAEIPSSPTFASPVVEANNSYLSGNSLLPRTSNALDIRRDLAESDQESSILGLGSPEVWPANVTSEEESGIEDTPLTSLPKSSHRSLGFSRYSQVSGLGLAAELVTYSETSALAIQTEQTQSTPAFGQLLDTQHYLGEPNSHIHKHNTLLNQLKTIADSVGLVEEKQNARVKQLETDIYRLRQDVYFSPTSRLRSPTQQDLYQSIDRIAHSQSLNDHSGTTAVSIAPKDPVNKRASWQSTVSDSSTTSGSQMPLNTSTSCGSTLVAAFVEKVTELEQVNRAILEERDYLENRAHTAESEYQRIKRELKSLQASALERQENRLIRLPSSNCQRPLRPSRTVSADDCRVNLDTRNPSETRETGLLKYDSKYRQAPPLGSLQRHGRFSHHDQQGGGDEKKHSHTRTLSLVEKLSKQRTYPPEAQDPIQHTEERLSGKSPLYSCRTLDPAASCKNTEPEYDVDEDVILPLYEEQQTLTKRRVRHLGERMKPDDFYTHIEDTDREGLKGIADQKSARRGTLVPTNGPDSVRNALFTKGASNRSNSRAMVMIDSDGSLLSTHSSTSHDDKEDFEILPRSSLASNELVSSFENVLAPIETFAQNVATCKSRVVGLFVAGFVWIQFAAYLIVAISVTMYKGPSAAGIEKGPTSPQRLLAAGKSRHKDDKNGQPVFMATNGASVDDALYERRARRSKRRGGAP